MAEARLRQLWTGLMPAFPEPATLLDIGDPDDRAVTMLLKTLYIVFKGVLEERHQLRCCEHRTNAPEPGTTTAESPTDSANADTVAAGSEGASVEEIVPCSPGDLVPPSPGNAAHLSGSRGTAPGSAPSARSAVLAPETADVTSPRRPGELPRAVAETAPPPVVWVPETLDAASPTRPDRRPRPVAETVQVTPPRPVRQSEAVSPVLPGRIQGSRRARRAANRTGAAASPVQPQPQTPPQMTTTAKGVGESSQTAEKGGGVASPDASLTSPLLLPQRLPERPRHPAVPEATLAQSPKKRTEKTATSSVRKASKLSRAKPSQSESSTQANSAQHRVQTGSLQQAPPAKKKKFTFIGPDDPVPPRKSRGAAAPQIDAECEVPPPESPTLLQQGRPPGESVSRHAVIPTNPAKEGTAVPPTERRAQSIFELPAVSSATQQLPSSRGSSSNNGPTTGKSASPRRNIPFRKSAGVSGGSAPAEGGGGPSRAPESVVGIDSLLDELNSEGAQTQAQQLAGGQVQGQGRERNPERGQTERQGVALDGEDPQAREDDEGALPQETTSPPYDHPAEHESQDETQMDSLVFGDGPPAAGPSFRYAAGPVRRRADRQKLPGWACNLCKQWYADRDMTEEELRAHMNKCSRHRQREPPPPDTPPGFWDPVGFPSMNITQYGGEGPRTRARRKL